MHPPFFRWPGSYTEKGRSIGNSSPQYFLLGVGFYTMSLKVSSKPLYEPCQPCQKGTKSDKYQGDMIAGPLMHCMPNNWTNITTTAFRVTQSTPCTKVRIRCKRGEPPSLFEKHLAEMPPPL